MTTVLLVDDQPLLRTGFRLVVESEPDLEVVGEAADGRVALSQVAGLAPDVVLMDIRMPGMDGVEATRRIVAEHPDSRVLVLTTFDVDDLAFAALRAGASGFLLKSARPDELVDAIRTVAAGTSVVAPRVLRRMLDLFAPHLPAGAEDGDPQERTGPHPRLRGLTPRELDVLRLIAEGASNAEIAAELVVSETTVKTHVGNVFAKLGARDRVQAVIIAYECGVVTAS
ncbi:two component transcriptional regulator, LuxR family [Cellulomonas flavigena DSM 20109]|uniref:Two component transcriptional regulator, LuxR family n=1 Tax=Cellulomonas flavigena (strain ATCC 482 / DSM 20109 / BCRC 11376 / JCM 18109 / NBRC 3775 / NCIMB 8073 / NRS 134) TaxID=446466 RepID=D5UJT8_CELFN|nr:response regulator transcription factor [Cellulomonas flavigena]ADG75726.1 two component transcriptional regulator, LuxR family [Cellulomonas flavigena DSM 20109]